MHDTKKSICNTLLKIAKGTLTFSEKKMLQRFTGNVLMTQNNSLLKSTSFKHYFKKLTLELFQISQEIRIMAFLHFYKR